MVSQSNSIKMLPHNDDAEKALLCSLLLEPARFVDISLQIKSSAYFYRPNHQVIYDAIVQILNGANGNKGLDLLTLSDYLMKHKLLEKAGGSSYLAEITNFDAIVSNIQNYADMVRESYKRRELYKIATSLAVDAFDNSSNITETLQKGYSSLTDLFMDMGTRAKEKSLEIGIKEIFENILEAVKDDGIEDNRVKSGFYLFDKYNNGGFAPEDYVIIAARPSIGKTAFAISMMKNMIYADEKVAFFSLEMPSQKIYKRLLSIDSRVPASRISTNVLIDDDLEKIYDSAERLFSKGENLCIVDVPNISLSDLRAKAKSLKIERGITVVVIDYIGLISLDNSRFDMPTFERVSQISKGLKSLARELGIPVIVLCQVSRDSEEKEPILSNLRDSGSIEQDADVVCFLHRKRKLSEEEMRMNAKDRDGRPTLQVTKMIVAKNRDGETGEFKIGFHSATTAYEDISSQDALFISSSKQ